MYITAVCFNTVLNLPRIQNVNAKNYENSMLFTVNKKTLYDLY